MMIATDTLYSVQECGLAIDKGVHRKSNEDSALSLGVGLADGDLRHTIGVYAVADGMGGHDFGENASQLALHTAVREVVHAVTDTRHITAQQYRLWLQRAVHVANRVVYRQNGDYKTGEGMGTTLVIALVVDDHAHIASVGDSRAYLINTSGIHQVTNDHSLSQMLVDHGAITPEQAAVHPYRNILSKAVGLEAEVEVDTFTVELQQGNALLLCSDGLNGELSDSTIYEIVRQADTPQAACDALVSAANEAGGHDNVSAVLVQLKPVPVFA